MSPSKTLRLRKEALHELAEGDLEKVVGGTTSMFTCQLPQCESPFLTRTLLCER